MAKIEFPKEKIELKAAPTRSKVSGAAFGITKFILGILLLPFVYSTTISFLSQFDLIDKSLQSYFWSGVIAFLIVYLFVWEPAKIYAKGQRILELVFRFFAPLVRVAPYVLPVYFILISVGFLLFSLAVKTEEFSSSGIFLFGFSLSLHLVFSAKTMRSRQGDFLKANYIFGFSLVYIINLIILAFVLNLIFANFSFTVFFNHSFQKAADLIYAIYKQLFVQ